MSITATCDTCFKEYALKESLAGKKVKCKGCGGVFRVPTLPEEAMEIGEFLEPERPLPKPTPRVPSPSARRRPAPQQGPSIGMIFAMIKIGIIASVGVIVVGWMVLASFGVFGPPAQQPAQNNPMMPPGVPGMPPGMPPFAAPPGFPGTGPTALAGTTGDPNSLFPVDAVPRPAYPELGFVRPLPGSQVQIHDVSFAPANSFPTAPGMLMDLRVYLPTRNAPPRSQGCVLVAPAGTNLIVGNGLDDPNYHDETLPYANAGYVTIMFSLDGGVRDLRTMSDGELSRAYGAFSAAQAGLVNARNALEFALAKLPQVDPQRIYIAGHSSAAVLALLFAEHETRLRGCIAYAPASDVEQRLRDLTNDPRAERLLPGIKTFVKRSSPRTHMANMQCPVFLFHAADDSNEPVQTSVRFAADLERLRKRVKFAHVPTGDHYDSMIREGIPGAIRWMGEQEAGGLRR